MLSKTRKIALALIISSVVAGAFVAWALVQAVTIPSQGNISTLRVFWNDALTNETTSINWGSLTPGQNKTLTVWAKNTGNTALTMHLNVTNWVPSHAAGYLQVTWNRESTVIPAYNSLSCELKLTVFSNITTALPPISDFSNDITIWGESA